LVIIVKKQSALLIDIIQSRELEQRSEVQNAVFKLTVFLNDVFKTQIIKDIEFSSGDALQGLLVDSGSAFLYFRALQLFLYPVKLRATIGYGTISFNDARYSSNAIDGEAYHNARAGMECIYNSNGIEIVYVSNQREDLTINLLFNSYTNIWKNITTSIYEVMLINELLNPLTLIDELTFSNFKEILAEVPLNFMGVQAGDESLQLIATKIAKIKKSIFQQALNLQKAQATKTTSFRFDNNVYVSYGIQNIIAEQVGTTRQNIQKIFSNNIKDERMYAAEIALYLNEKG